MNITTTHQYKMKAESSVQSLTKLLDRLIQELNLDVPETISISFDGTEVYQYHTHDTTVYWWGTESDEVS